MEPGIVAAAIAEAHDSGQPVADVPLDQIARRAGMSRSTFFRRVRTRTALEDAVRAAGVDPGQRPSVRERAIDAAARLVVDDGVAALTVEEVAREVGCAVTSVHTQFRGRDDLLRAVFEQNAPLPGVERKLTTEPEHFVDLATGVRAIYSEIIGMSDRELGVVVALIAEALAKPDGTAMALARDHILPRITQSVGRWLTGQVQAGNCTDLPLSVLIPLLISPISVHIVARKRQIEAGHPVPDAQDVADAMANAFCAAVATDIHSRGLS